MASLKGLALGLTAIIAVGYIATKTGAAKGISGVAQAVTQTFMAPFKGIGEGLSTMGVGISKVLSPRVEPTFAPKFDWSEWMPFGPPSKNGNGVRAEDRNNGNGIIAVSHVRIDVTEARRRELAAEGRTGPLYTVSARPEDRNNGLAML
ncbi:unnamed protein product [marine sediment metagenome]|uniref:Uncharacterized protein n=1 Tax=marine sediment metagenome TaxID=412755 RepID=X1IVH6_9ZZZZ